MTDKTKRKETVVWLVNNSARDNRYLVMDESGSAYLVPVELLSFTMAPQVIDSAVLETAEKPYDFTAEIQAVMPTVEQVRLAVWRNGLIYKDDLKNPHFARLALYGAFPIELNSIEVINNE